MLFVNLELIFYQSKKMIFYLSQKMNFVIDDDGITHFIFLSFIKFMFLEFDQMIVI